MTDLVLEFDEASQSLVALQKAAYRLVGQAVCHIDKANGRYQCRIEPLSGGDVKDLRVRFLQVLSDENVRVSIDQKTEPVRNLILALAFGSLAKS